jgi:hypothetical protein
MAEHVFDLSAGGRAHSREAVAVFLHYLDRPTTTVEVDKSITVLPRDPKDEPYLTLAVTLTRLSPEPA